MSLSAAVLAPVFAQIALTFALLFWMGALRTKALRSKAVRQRDIALGQQNWPEQATKVANSFSNQFEIPVLFYVLTALQWMLGAVDQVTITLAWAFVVTRYAHAAEFTTANYVVRRGLFYIIGVMILLANWVVFAVRVFSS